MESKLRRIKFSYEKLINEFKEKIKIKEIKTNAKNSIKKC
jgi:hypothetical protein